MDLVISVALHFGGKAWGWNSYLAKTQLSRKPRNGEAMARNRAEEPPKRGRVLVSCLMLRNYSFKYNQQNATLYNILYYCQCSTCFRRLSPPIIRSSKTVHTASGKCQACLLLPPAWVICSISQLTHPSGSSKQAWHLPDAVCTVFELLMMGGETAWNMQSTDSNKEYCITLHLVGCT